MAKKVFSLLAWGLIICFPLLFPKSYLLSVLIFAGVWSIMLIGFDVLVGYCGQLSLGHNAFFAIGAYSAGILAVKFNFQQPLLAMAIGVGISLVLAWTIGLPSLRLKGYYLAIATLGFGLVINNFIVGLNELTGGASGLNFIPSFKLAGFTFDTDIRFYFLVWFFVAVTLVVSLNLVKSRFGRAFMAIQEEETFASMMRIPVSRYKLFAFLYSAVCASIAGSLYAHYAGTITPEGFGFMISIHMVVMLFLGGKGTIWGGIIGAVFLKLLSEWLTAFQEYEMPIWAAIFIMVLIFMPKGLLGGLQAASKNFRIKTLNLGG
jgi:branched-chain amino acid transport system permease protein